MNNYNNSHLYSPLTTNGSTLSQHGIVSNNITSNWKPPSKLVVQGDDADIIINDVSLNDTLKGIQERLNILTPNPKLEAEWDELRELGERYRALEKELTSASKMWKILSRD